MGRGKHGPLETMNKRRLLAVLLIAGLFLLPGCKKVPELSEAKVREDLIAQLESAKYEYDAMEQFGMEEIKTDPADLDKLKGFFDKPVQYRTMKADFVLTSLTAQTTAQYALIYALNDGWQMMFARPLNENEWTYQTKESVSHKQMLTDLQDHQFDGFEAGYIGEEKNTSLEIKKRKTDLKKSSDDILALVTVKTDFATYKLEVHYKYFYADGQWRADAIEVQDSSKWKVAFQKKKEPKAPSEKAILKLLTTKSNFLTYVANPKYYDSQTIKKLPPIARDTSLTFKYEMETSYRNIGIIKYQVSVPYEWIEGEWASGEAAVAVIDADPVNMLGKWTAKNGDVLEIFELEGDVEEKQASASLLNVRFMRNGGKKSERQPYTGQFKINVPLRDNKWELICRRWDTLSGKKPAWQPKKTTIDTRKKQIVINGVAFTKTTASVLR